MYRRITVAVDGSDTANLGLREALNLASAEGARLRAVHVVDENMIAAAKPFPLGGDAEMVSALKASGERALKEAAAAATRRRVAGDYVQRLSADRAVSDVILAEAEDWRADVIVMGTHGRRGLNRLLMGSDAERILREARVPLLLVKAVTAREKLKTRRGVQSRRD